MEELEYLKLINDWKENHKEEIKQGKVRKVFYENLPKKYGQGANINKLVIDWFNSIGYKIKGIYDDIEFEVEIIKYYKKTSYVLIKYQDTEFKILANGFKKCGFGKILGKITKEFKIEIGQTFKDDKRDITITDRKKIPNQHNEGKYLKYYKYTCNKCGFDCGEHYSIRDKEYKEDFWIVESSLVNGIGCSCCCCTPNIVVENINSIYKTDKWMIPIINDDEFCKTHTRFCNEEIYPTCIDCSRKRNKQISICNLNKYHGFSCSCGDNIKYPNKFAFNMLDQLNVNFEIEKYFDWCKYKFKNKIQKGYYDFYFKLNNKEYILEMDGSFHNKNNKMSGQTKEESKYIDNEKDRLALEHNIEVIRIDCDYQNEDRFNYIQNNILNNDKINELFDLFKINWLKIEEFTLSNLVKKSCEIKRDNTELTVMEISKLMNLNEQTVRKYLKRGTNIWNWINYNAKEESKKRAIKNGKVNYIKLSKPIICTNTGDLFFNTTKCEELSFNIFGIQLNKTCIGDVCRRKQKQTRGFNFKYISDLTSEEYIKYNIANKLKELNKIA